MRYHVLAIGFLLLATPATGCKPAETKAAPVLEQPPTAALAYEKAKVETKQAAEAIADYGYAQRDQFIAVMKVELNKTQAEIAGLASQVEKGNEAIKADANLRLEVARTKWTHAKDALKQAESATVSNWDQFKAGFKSSYGEMHDQVAQTRRWLSEKIAP